MFGLSKDNCAVTFESDEVLLCLAMISSRSTLSCSYFIFSSLFWRKQKNNVSKSGLYKPNLKLMSVSTAEGQMWTQRFVLEVWPGLGSLALTQRLTLRHARNSLGTSRLKPHLKHLSVLLQCAVHCPTAEACSRSAPPALAQCFCKLLKHALVKLGWTEWGLSAQRLMHNYNVQNVIKEDVGVWSLWLQVVIFSL